MNKKIIKSSLVILSVLFLIFAYKYQIKIMGHIPPIYNHYQPINSKYLVDTNQSIRIIPHRVDSIGKLDDIWKVGFRSFECDVRFGDNNISTFKLGHDAWIKGADFETFLLSQNTKELKKVWLDFKNLDSSNYKQALNTLNNLDKKYTLKNKFIVESNTKDNFFKEFRDNGWQTCYYTPTSLIKKLLKDDNKDEMVKLAQKMSKQLKAQNISAVSFYDEIYPFIKKYLEPEIPNNIVYHIWYSPALYDYNFKNKLLNYELYKDKRVKTLLSTFRSKFNM